MAKKGERKRSNRPKSSKRPRNAEVVETAARIFYERGYVGASVGDIAEELGILKGSLYYYIDSKEELLFEIVDEVHKQVRTLLAAALARDDLSARDRLALYVRTQTEYNARNAVNIAVYYRDLDHLSEPKLKDIRGRQSRHFRSLVDLIAAAQEEGDVSADLDPKLGARGVLATMIWTYTWYRAGGPIGPDELGDFCVRFALAGLVGYGGVAEPAADLRYIPNV